MQTKSNSQILVAVAIVIGAIMICATLLALNVRTVYPMTDRQIQTEYLQLVQSGCTDVSITGGGLAAISCPLWVRP
jgi:hypothetical protein